MAMVSAVLTIDEVSDWKIAIPAKGLASQSVLIERKEKENFAELFQLMQKVARFWEARGINHYLAYTSSQETSWEMVPYQGNPTSFWDKIWAFCRQLQVVTRVI